jgi:hypothetical protein
MHAGLTSVWEQQTDDEAKEVEAMFDMMSAAMSSSVAPGEPEPPEDVAAAAFVIGADLSDSANALEPSTPDPGTALGWVAPLIGEALDEYKASEPGVAEAIVRDVDTEVYGAARDALQSSVPDVAADVDRLLGRLVRLIQAGAPVAQLEQAVDDASSAARFAAGQVPGGV